MGEVKHILARRQKIVCIDDQSVQLRVLVDTIGSFEIPRLEVVKFLDPERAARYIQSNSDISLIITDYYMPQKSGAELIRELRNSATGYSVPILVVTASDKKSDHEAALEAGALDCIQRPVSRDYLYLKIKNHLLTHSAQDGASQSSQLSSVIERDVLAELLMRISHINTGVEVHEGCKSAAALARAVMQEIGGRGVMMEGITTLIKIADIGVVGLPTRLQKPENQIQNMTDRVLYEAHSKIGYQLLKEIDNEYYRNMAKLVLHHHENYDGTGYPHALKEGEIPLESRIVRAVKAFVLKQQEYMQENESSLTAARTEALYHLKENSGTLYDPAVVNAISNVMEKDAAA